MSFTQVFGGNTIYPSDVSYLALTLEADVPLQWPLEAAVGNNLVARIIDVTSEGLHSIFMPDATQTGVGRQNQAMRQDRQGKLLDIIGEHKAAPAHKRQCLAGAVECHHPAWAGAQFDGRRCA